MDGQKLPPHYELILCSLPPLSVPDCLALFTRTLNKEENKNEISKATENMEKEERRLEIEENEKIFRKSKAKENKTVGISTRRREVNHGRRGEDRKG
jgi:hypothetical protein